MTARNEIFETLSRNLGKGRIFVEGHKFWIGFPIREPGHGDEYRHLALWAVSQEGKLTRVQIRIVNKLLGDTIRWKSARGYSYDGAYTFDRLLIPRTADQKYRIPHLQMEKLLDSKQAIELFHEFEQREASVAPVTQQRGCEGLQAIFTSDFRREDVPW